MALGQGQARIFGEPAQDPGRESGLASLDQKRGMVGAGHPVEHEAHHLDLLPPAQEAVDERGHRAAEPGAVDHEDDR
jgi:hypothetical protein